MALENKSIHQSKYVSKNNCQQLPLATAILLGTGVLHNSVPPNVFKLVLRNTVFPSIYLSVDLPQFSTFDSNRRAAGSFSSTRGEPGYDRAKTAKQH